MMRLHAPSGARRVALHLGAVAAVGLLARYQFRVMKRRAARRRWVEAEQRLRDEIPVIGAIAAQGAAVAATCAHAERFMEGVKKIARILERAGAELQEALSGDPWPDGATDGGAAEEFLAVWQGAGEAKRACSAQMLALVEELSVVMAELESTRKQSLEEGDSLRNSLVDEEARLAAAASRGWFSWLQWSEHLPACDAEQQRCSENRVLVTATLGRFLKNLEAMQGRGDTAIASALEGVRKASKVVGETIAHLRRGSDAGPAAPRAPAARGARNSFVGNLLRNMTTPAGRQRLRDAEAAQNADAKVEGGPSKQPEEAPMSAPPVKHLGDGSWRIQGLYEHQALKVGLRCLDAKWGTEGLLELPRGKDGGALLYREGLFKQLLVGRIRLQSVTGNDLAAAQCDIDSLTLRQLLRLRVQHIDFTPSGCGADTVTAVGGIHETFLSKLDALLFRRLGGAAAGGELAAGELDTHRLGREAVLFAAAAAAVSTTPWWCWWLAGGERRVFFDAAGFRCAPAFPGDAGGVLEVTDLSKRDRHEPTGRLRWLDWRIDLVAEESKLSPTPLRGTEAPPGSTAADAAPSTRGPEGSAEHAGEALPAMPAMSAQVLQDTRSMLRKTGGSSARPAASPGSAAS